MKNVFYKIPDRLYRWAIAFLVILLLGNTRLQAQCGSNTSGGTVTATNTGISQTWPETAKQYVQVNSVTNGGTYVVSSSTGTDYITVRTTSANAGPVITSGTSPVTFTATATTVYIILTTNSGCSTSNTSRTITMSAKPNITAVSASACAGSTFTLTGTAFSGVTSVSINGTNAPTFTVSSSTSITVTVPSGATSGTVSVTGPGGTSTSGSSITITALPTVTPGSTLTACESASPAAITLSGAGVGGSATTGAWSITSGAGSLSSTAQTATPATVTYTPAANTSGNVTLTLTTNAPGACAAVSNTRTITVNPLPLNNAGADKAVCTGSSVAIGASSTVGHTYSWSPTTGLSSSIVANPTCSATVTTAYTLTETITATGCSVSNTATVTVNPLPTNISPTGATTICAGNSANISIANSQTGINYQLRNNTGNVSVGSPVAGTGSTILLPTGNIVASTTYNVLATDATTGCSLAMTGTVLITVNPIPGDNAGADKAICSGLSTTIGAASTVGHTYSWSPSSNLSSATASNPTCTTLNTTTYTLTETITATGCSASYSAVVTVNPLPIDNAGADTVICSGVSATIGAASTVGHTYSWSPTTSLTSSTIANPVTSTTASRTYTLTETITATGCTASNAINVTVNPLPVNHTPAGATTMCAGNSANITVPLSQIGVNYQLRNNTGNTSVGSPVAGTGATINLPTGSLNSSTTFNVLAIDATTGCSLQMTGTVLITVNPIPTDNAGANKSLCNGSSVSIGAASTVGHTYSWSPATSLSSATVANPTCSATVTTVYTLTETITATGCTASNAATVTVNPLPTNITPTGTATICTGTSANISIAGSQTGINYQLRNNTGNTNVGSAVAGTGGTINLPTGNISSNTTYNVLATDATTGCSLQMTGTVTITINPLAVSTAGGPNTTCIAFPATAITLSGASVSGGASTGAWSIVSGGGTLSSTAQTASPSTVTYTPVTGNTGTVTLALTTNATGACPAVTSNRTITLNPLPAPTISSNYCGSGTGFTLTCSAQTTYAWSTGATTQSITDSVADIYTITVTNSYGCSGSVSADIGGELVVNGNFSSGNTGFTSVYTNNQSSIFVEGNYAITANANTQHPLFYGTDHNNPGTGLFMAVNGAPSTIAVWQQTVTVVPNTTYYFSAFAMSMNQVSPYAQLQFSINNTLQGSPVQLPQGAASTSGPFPWQRIYVTWNSGSSTSALLAIYDQSIVLGGNDFGLDDISFSQLAAAPFTVAATSNTPVCAGNAINLTATPTGGNYPLTYSWAGPSSYTSTSQTGTLSSATSAMGGTYSVTVTDARGCSVSSSNAVTVNALPTDKTPTAVASTVCSGSSTNIQILTSQSGVNYQLRNNSGNTTVGSAVAGTGGTINLSTGALSTSTTFNVLATNATTGCNVQMVNTVTVNVSTTYTIAAGGPDAACQASSPSAITLSGASVGNGATTAAWSITSGGGTLSSTAQTASPASVTYTPAANYTGAVSLTLTSNAPGACPAVTATRSITVNALPTNITPTAQSSNICQGSSTNIKVTLSQTGVNYQLRNNSGNANIGSAVAGTGATINLPTGNLSSTTVFNVLATNATTGCSVQMTTTVSVTVTTPYTVTPGGPDNACQASSPAAITLSGASVGNGATTGAWSISSGGGTLSSTLQTATPATVTYTPAANYTGSVTLTLTTNAPGVCSANSSTRTITVNALPTSITPTAQASTICTGSSTNILIAGSQSGFNYQLRNNSGNVAVGSAVAGTGSTISLPTGNLAANTTFNVLATNASGGCSLQMSGTVTVTVTAQYSITTGGPDNVCQSASPAALTLSGASVGSGATTGAWSITSGGGTLSNTAQTATPATVTYTPAANYTGPVTLTLTTNAPGTCPAASATRTINVNAAATVTPAGPDAACQSASPAAITLNGASFGGSATTVAWSITSGGGSLSSTAQTASPATVTYTPAANYTGSVILTLTSNVPTSCAAVNATRTITVNALPTNITPTAQASTICSGSSTNIQIAGSQTGVNYQLRNNTGNVTIGSAVAGTGGTINLPTGNLSSNTTFNVLATNATTGCNQQMTGTVTVSVSSPYTVTPGGPNSVCQSASPSAIILTGASVGNGATTGAWSITSGGGTLSSTAQTLLPAIVTYTPAANYSGSITLTLTTNAPGSCPATSGTRTITVNAKPAATAGSNAPVCTLNTLNLTSGPSGMSSYAWSGPVAFSSNVQNPTRGSLLTVYSGTYTVTVTDANGCSNSASLNASIFSGTAGLWLGSVSTNWSDANNWCAGIPTSTTDVTIPAGTTYSPVISGNATCHDLDVQSGNSLAIVTGGDLKLYGNMDIDGSYNHSAGTLELVGSTNQTISGVKAANVIVNNSHGVSISGNLAVSGTLTLTKGLITTGNYKVDVQDTLVTAIQTPSDSSYISGNLSRGIGSSGNYLLPVGTSSHYELAEINFASNPGKRHGGIDSLSAFFKASTVTCANVVDNLGLRVNNSIINELLNGGVWTIHPDTSAYSGVSYSATLHQKGHTNPPGSAYQMAVIKRPDCPSAWQSLGVHVNQTQSLANGTATAARSQLSSFSDFGIGISYSEALPVTLIYLEAEAMDNSYIQARWGTATEINNQDFEIERSTDALNWSKIGVVAGNGNSTKERYYSYNDSSAVLNVQYYYRLKQVDFNGNYQYTNMVTAIITAQVALGVENFYPNPASGKAFLMITTAKDQDINIDLFDMMGQKALSSVYPISKAIDNKIEFDLRRLGAGTYTAVVSSGKDSSSKKLVIMR